MVRVGRVSRVQLRYVVGVRALESGRGTNRQGAYKGKPTRNARGTEKRKGRGRGLKKLGAGSRGAHRKRENEKVLCSVPPKHSRVRELRGKEKSRS